MSEKRDVLMSAMLILELFLLLSFAAVGVLCEMNGFRLDYTFYSPFIVFAVIVVHRDHGGL